MATIKMKYSEYKNNWYKCKTASETYDAETKTIDVIIPDMIWELYNTIPMSEIDEYRKELIKQGAPEFANTFSIVECFADDMRGAVKDDFAPEYGEWVEKAFEIING